jgi:hypothetical protein
MQHMVWKFRQAKLATTANLDGHDAVPLKKIKIVGGGRPLSPFEVAVLIQIARGVPFTAVEREPVFASIMSNRAKEIGWTIDSLRDRTPSVSRKAKKDVQTTAEYFLQMSSVNS